MAREKGMGNLQREKSGRWTMRVGLNGKRYCRSTRTKDRDKAERILQRFLAPLGLGENRLPLAEVWLEYVKSPKRNELAPSTLKGKQLVWMHFARWMTQHHLEVDDLAGVTADAIAEYLACLRVDHCASTYNGRVCILREIFRVLSDKAGLDDDPWEGVRLRPDDSHSRRELTLDELKRLLMAARKAGEEWHKLFLIGIYTGLRLGDCCKLDWSSINLGSGIIQLIPSKTRRHAHGHPITIPIHAALQTALTTAESGAKSFVAPSSGPVLPRIAADYRTVRWRVSHVISRIFAEADIVTSVRVEGRTHLTPEATFHSLRHTFVSLSANAGVPLHIVQSIVGHESTAMTRHYYHENINVLRSAVNAIPALNETLQPKAESATCTGDGSSRFDQS